ncbi:hypothetical protein Tco_0180336 [Tanacetum coccineum]
MKLSELRDQSLRRIRPNLQGEDKGCLHDSKIRTNTSMLVISLTLFNSPIKDFLGKLKSRWSGPFTITRSLSLSTASCLHAEGLSLKDKLNTGSECQAGEFRGPQKKPLRGRIESSLRLGDQKQAASWEFIPCLSFLFSIYCVVLREACMDKLKNHKKAVKNEQARTREPEEYKAKARKAKPQSKSAKVSQRWSTKVNKPHNIPF